MNITEAFKNLKNGRRIVEERQADIDQFNQKFGQGKFEKFKKLRDRLKNRGVSVDIVYHTKNTSAEDMENLLNQAENRITLDDKGQVKNNYKLVQENEYYRVLDILDWETSMNLGDGTMWCISGRYQTNGKVKPSQAKQYFNEYSKFPYNSILFFMPKGNEEKYCFCIRGKNNLSTSKYDTNNFDLWNQSDDLVDCSEYWENDKFPKFSYKDFNNSVKYKMEIKDGILYSFRDESRPETIEIPEGVIEIQDSVFTGETSLLYVKLPSTLIKIGKSAFSSCSSLRELTIPDRVKEIGSEAFNGCHSINKLEIGSGVMKIGTAQFNALADLEELYIPDNLKTIQSSAFQRCTSLKRIKLPSKLKKISQYAFSYCTSLTEISLPENIKEIGQAQFQHCAKLTKVNLPKNLQVLGQMQFYCCGLTEIKIPGTVKEIEVQQFSRCCNLTTLILEEGVEEIQNGQFYGCNPKTITIPASVTSIGREQFWRASENSGFSLMATGELPIRDEKRSPQRPTHFDPREVTFMGDRSKIKISQGQF